MAEEKVVKTKHEKFQELSEQRINKAVKYINNLVPLSNTSSYDFTKEEVDKMFSYLEESVDNAKSAFNVAFHKRSSKSKGFTHE